MGNQYIKDFLTLKGCLEKFVDIGWPTGDGDIKISEEVYSTGMYIITDTYCNRLKFPKIAITDENELTLAWETFDPNTHLYVIIDSKSIEVAWRKSDPELNTLEIINFTNEGLSILQHLIREIND
jgi:hypothetical protein